MEVTATDFNNTLEQFKEFEQGREFWLRARKLLDNGFEAEAYILILATWNFAGFRYTLKTFDMKKFEGAIERANANLNKFQNVTLKEIDLEDPEVVESIKNAYSEFKSVAQQTGAAKMLSVKNPSLFVMWDTNIRKFYKIKNEGSPSDYIEFLRKMQEMFSPIEWNDAQKTLAKAIDEFNFVKANF